jgi:hypothetical protein
MTEQQSVSLAKPGDRLIGSRGRSIGRVEAVFVDYLLVRTRSLLPVDLYVPADAIRFEGGAVLVDLDRSAAYHAWHRPLKRAPHA